MIHHYKNGCLPSSQFQFQGKNPTKPVWLQKDKIMCWFFNHLEGYYENTVTDSFMKPRNEGGL